MKLLIATALFPPDIAEPAPYLKELARRLTPTHQMSILTYGTLPEAVDGVAIYTVSKQRATLLRVVTFTYRLFALARRVDRVLIQNGISTELPALIVSLFYGRRFILHMSDHKVTYVGWQDTVHRMLCGHIRHTIEITAPSSRPEILPFEDYPQAAFDAYEQSWQRHLHEIGRAITQTV